MAPRRRVSNLSRKFSFRAASLFSTHRQLAGALNFARTDVLAVALQYDCPDPDCAFRVRANTEYEVFAFVERHSQRQHGVWRSGREMHASLTEL